MSEWHQRARKLTVCVTKTKPGQYRHQNMLNIKELKKTYASGIQALKGITLDVAPGMFGLLGPNGAGKTTLMKILATLLEADSGAAQMNGVDLIRDKHGTRKMLGYLPQEFGLYPSLTA